MLDTYIKMKKYLLPVRVTWIIATIGLIWQVYQVSKMFFTFSTRMDIEMDSPLNLTLPAITICIPLKPNLVTLKGYLNGATNLTNHQLLEEMLYIPINVLATVETIDVKVFCRTKYPKAMVKAPEGLPCDSFGTTLHRLQYMEFPKSIFRCTTYLFQTTNDPPLTVIANDAKDFFQLDIYSPKPAYIFVYIHNPSEIFYLPESDFTVISTKQSSEVVVSTSRTTINLPRKHYSHCSDYSGSKFGRMSCIFRCRNRVTEANCGSWSYKVPAPLNTTKSFFSKTANCTSKNYKCNSFDICPVQCSSCWISTSLVWHHMKEMASNVTRFYVRRPYGLEFVYNVTPYLAPIEYSCYIASSLGIWFGVSFSDIMLRLFGLQRLHKLQRLDKMESKRSRRKISLQKHYKTMGKASYPRNDINYLSFNFRLESSSNQIDHLSNTFPSTYPF